jgi:hypothetical protein
MNNRLTRLADRIRTDIAELERVIYRIDEGWRRAKSSEDDYYLDGVALNLHGFYSGLERIFELIAEVVDGSIPQGENWHQLLLEQVGTELPGIRPAVISDDARMKLNDYRGFRHVVRNVYTFKFDPLKVGELVDEAPGLFRLIRDELLTFASFLEQVD